MLKRKYVLIRRTILTLFSACLLVFSGIFPASAFAEDAGIPGDAEQVAAVILHTNDVHVAFEDNIGYDGLALYKKELEAVYDHILLIDAGDAIRSMKKAGMSSFPWALSA